MLEYCTAGPGPLFFCFCIFLCFVAAVQAAKVYVLYFVSLLGIRFGIGSSGQNTPFVPVYSLIGQH